MSVYTYKIEFVPGYFSRACSAYIPARWTAWITSGLPESLHIYSDGCQSKEEAIADLIAQAKKFDLSGLLRRDH